MIKSKPHIEADQFKPLKMDSQLEFEISDIRTVNVSTSQEIGYTLLNRELLGDVSPIVAPGSFMSDLTTVSRAYEGVSLASLDRPVLMIDILGHGHSSPHNLQQIYDLCFNRSIEKQATPLLETVLAVLSDNDPIDYFGISYAGLLSLEMARNDPGDRVNNVFGLDIPAVKKRWSLGVQLGYILLDGQIGRNQYKKYLKNSPAFINFDNFSDDFNCLEIEQASSFIKNNPSLAGLNMLMSISARPVAFDIWSEIMEQKSASVDIVTAELSRVSDYQEIELFIDSLVAEYQSRCYQTVIHGEDHNIGMAHLIPRAVNWASQAYKINLEGN